MGELGKVLKLRFRKETDAPRSVEVSIPSSASQCDLDGSDKHAGSINLASPEAEYDEKANEYFLDFHGRVTESASCNFQLAVVENGFRPGPKASLCMQFGKVNSHT